VAPAAEQQSRAARFVFATLEQDQPRRGTQLPPAPSRLPGRKPASDPGAATAAGVMRQVQAEANRPVADLGINFTYGTVTYMLAALTFVTALAWRDALNRYFNEKHKLKDFGPWASALLISGLAIILVLFLSHIKNRIRTKFDIPLAREL
jgi:hypothetical protein